MQDQDQTELWASIRTLRKSKHQKSEDSGTQAHQSPGLLNGVPDKAALVATEGAVHPAEAGAREGPHRQLQEQLVAIWERLFNLRPIGLHDSFFDLGGNPRLALALFAEIRKLTGRHYCPALLVRARTISQLSRLLSRESPEVGWASLVPVQPHGSRPPFFLVHACNGEVFLYQQLIQHLDPDQPVFCFQARGLDGHETPFRTVEEMAAHYLRELQAKQPKGPYYLGGKHVGSLIALEMAQRLTAQGHHVELLVLLGSINLRANPALRRLARNRAGSNGSRLRLANPDYLFSRVREIGRQTLHRTKTRFSAILSRPSSSKNGSPMTPKRRINRLINPAMTRYLPKLYSGRVVMFQPVGKLDRKGYQTEHRENLAIYRALFPGDFHFEFVPGTDTETYSAYKKPHVAVLAEGLQAWLAKVFPAGMPTPPTNPSHPGHA